MWRTVLVLVGCGSSTSPPPLQHRPEPPPADGKLHDLTSESAEALHVRLNGTAVPLGEVPRVRESLALPVSGAATIEIDLVLPMHDLRAARGAIHIRCAKCQVGDDATKLVPAQPGGFFGDGIDFGHVTIDNLEARIEFAHGAARLVAWRFASPDLELELSLRSVLARDWASSSVHGCLRYKVRPELQQRSPKMAALFSIIGAPLGEDGYFHISLEGTLGDIKKLGRPCT